LVKDQVESIGLEPDAYGSHTLRRTKAAPNHFAILTSIAANAKLPGEVRENAALLPAIREIALYISNIRLDMRTSIYT
jgi:hypothetical protein